MLCQALYGPYAHNLDKVLEILEGHYIRGYGVGFKNEKRKDDEPKKQYDRVLQASQNGVVVRSQLDESRREYETARACLKAVESRLRDRLVKAPFSWVMGLRNISVGALIEPGDIISTLDDDSVMKLDFSLPATF